MDLSELKDYKYDIEESAIAQTPSNPRDSAKLLVIDTSTDTITHSLVSDLPQLLPDNTQLFMNTTSVVPARVKLNRISGGVVEMLFLMNESQHNVLKAVSKTKLKNGIKLYFEQDHVLTITSKMGMKYEIEWVSKVSIWDFLNLHGETPLPKYILHNSQTKQELATSYQTVFARYNAEFASVAAPTASLHFTESLLDQIRLKHAIVPIELHVGLGTFASLVERNFATKKLHTEWIQISDNSYQILTQTQFPILAVGTTSMRTLESLDRLQKIGLNWRGETDVFIFPPHTFKYADMLMTNFHVPESSLMLMVQAFLTYKGSKLRLVDVYKTALENGYRFYSLGDAMLIL